MGGHGLLRAVAHAGDTLAAKNQMSMTTFTWCIHSLALIGCPDLTSRQAAAPKLEEDAAGALLEVALVVVGGDDDAHPRQIACRAGARGALPGAAADTRVRKHNEAARSERAHHRDPQRHALAVLETAAHRFDKLRHGSSTLERARGHRRPHGTAKMHRSGVPRTAAIPIGVSEFPQTF